MNKHQHGHSVILEELGGPWGKVAQGREVLAISGMEQRREAQGSMILEGPGVLWWRVEQGLPVGIGNLVRDNFGNDQSLTFQINSSTLQVSFNFCFLTMML